MNIPSMLSMGLVNEFAKRLGWSAARDIEVIRYRCKHEGLSFLTITLPLLSDALERGLENGRLTCPSNFARHGMLPRLLGGLFRRVFSPCGEILPEPCVESIFAIRQICRFQKKLKIQCSQSRERAAIAKFKAVEEELFHASSHIATVEDKYLDSVSSVLWSQVFPEIDPVELRCKHGPGATAERFTANRRWSISYWYTRFERSFPLDLHAYHNYGSWIDSVGLPVGEGGIDEVGVSDEIPVRVVFVPKTLTSPRVIAIEPSSMQYVQQSLMSHMVGILESHRLTRNSVRFSDQSVNQSLAKSASVSRQLATLDLSDASDRVSLSLVNRIFKASGILDYLQDARSLSADLPDSSNVILSKYASMGSALCFPVEACVFYTLILAAMMEADKAHVNSRSIIRYSRMIDVYGDDIIVPVRYVDVVVARLSMYHLKVNESKSFRNSLFRESCGGDYFNGTDVKPVYLRQLLPDTPTTWTPDQVMSACATANQLYEQGLWSTCQQLRDLVSVAVRGEVPRARSPGQGVFFLSSMFTTACRYNRSLHRWEQRRVVYSPAKRPDRTPTTAGLFNRAFSNERLSTADTERMSWTEHLVRDAQARDYVSSTKRGVFKPKRQWVTAM